MSLTADEGELAWAAQLVERLTCSAVPAEILTRFKEDLSARFPNSGPVWLDCGPPVEPAEVLKLLMLAAPELDLNLGRVLAGALALALSQARLALAWKEAQFQLLESSRLKMVGQLAAGVAHDLATPLAAMMISVESASYALARNPTKVEERLQRALKAAEQAKSIAEKLLSQARPPAPIEQSFRLVDLVNETLEVYGATWRQQGAQFALEMAPVPPLVGRPRDLQQVLVNLIQNAVQASLHAVDRRVLIGCGRGASEALLTVSDYGPGIAAANLARIFDAFFTTKPAAQGTGLGLAVCQEIVQQHGGRLEVSSTPGEGATFSLHLPLPPTSLGESYRSSAPPRANPVS